MKEQTARAAVARVTIDRALKRDCLSLMRMTAETSREDARTFDRRYEAIGAALEHDPPLYLAGGFARTRAWFEAELHEDERSVRAKVRVAKYASPREEERYTPSSSRI